MIQRLLKVGGLAITLCYYNPPASPAQNLHAILFASSENTAQEQKQADVLKSRLTELASRYKVSIVYYDNQDLLEQPLGKKGVNKKLKPLETELEKLLKPTKLNYEIVNDNFFIIIPKGKPARAESSFQNTSNNIKSQVAAVAITGKITEANGTPLPGVTVLEKGTTNGTTTDASGNFSLNVASGNSTLVVSFIGFVSKEVPVNNQTTVNITLSPDAKALDEVVVVGYGTQQKVQLTGSISAIGSEDIQRTSGTTSGEALVGKIAGLTTRSTNTYEGDSRPGSATQLQIRNMGNPLFIIDGIPQTAGSFNNLNINDIDNISILKDAAAAVYGIRAANGVVLVTTKRGRTNVKPQIRVNGYYGWQNNTRFPFDPPASAYLFKRSQAEILQNAGQAPNITPEELEKWRIGAPGYESYNHYDNVFNNPNAAQYTLNASASGGSENTTYYFSVGHVNQDYLMKGHNFNRTNIQTNLKAGLAKGFSVGTQISARIENRDNVAIPGREDPIWNALLGTNSSWPMENIYANGNPKYINGNVRFLTRLPSTYTREIAGWQEDQWSAFTGNFFAEYDFKFGLVAKATYSHSRKLNTFERQRFSYDAYKYNPADDTYEVFGGFASPLRTKNRTLVTEQFAQLQASYKKELGNHAFSGVLAFELLDSEEDFVGVESIPPTNYSPLIRFENQNNLQNTWTTNAMASYVGRFTYDYKKKYLLELLGRYDGSYLYAPEKRWGLFPGISAGWRLTEEKFLQNRLGFLTELKLRASLGQAGQALASPWDYLAGATYGTSQYLLDGRVTTGARPRGLPITNLSWATSTSKNVGLEFAMFNNKFSGEFDVFERKLSGLPAARYDVLLPSEVGYTLPNENLESEAHRGVEGMLTFQSETKGIRYSLSANATLARRKILDRYKPRFGNSWEEYRNGIENRWANVNFGYQVIGQFKTEEEIKTHPINNDGQGNRTHLPGDFIYKDVNEDGVIDDLDLRPIGYALFDNPILGFGLNGTLEYRGFDLAFGFAGGTMYSFSQNLELKFPFQGGHNSPVWLLEDRWHRADLFEPSSEWVPGKYPVHRQNSGHANYRQSDFWRRNVNYMRLKRVEIGYNLPKQYLNYVRISNLRVFASGANLFSIDNMKDLQLDPELAIDSGLRYPTQRVINVGFDLTF